MDSGHRQQPVQVASRLPRVSGPRYQSSSQLEAQVDVSADPGNKPNAATTPSIPATMRHRCIDLAHSFLGVGTRSAP